MTTSRRDMNTVTSIVVSIIFLVSSCQGSNRLSRGIAKIACNHLEAQAPQFGKRHLTINSVMKFKCGSVYELKGEQQLTCLPNGTWSGKPPTCLHRCENITCGVGEKCQIENLKPKCVCRDNMECSSRLDSVCGSDGHTYTNECIMKATGCRKLEKIHKIQNGKCIPGDVCSITPISDCRAAFRMFYYNVTEGKCQRITVGGCHSSGWNGFWRKDDCTKHCIRDVCAMNPEVGPCTDRITRWYFDSTTKTCEQFKYGGCFGNPNNFRTESDCTKRCR